MPVPLLSLLLPHSSFAMPDKLIIPAPQTCVCLISICDHICRITILPLPQILRLMPHCTLTDPSRRFNQEDSQMLVSRFGDPQAVDIVTTGSFSRRKAKICCVHIPFCKPVKISGLYNQRQCRMGLDSQKTAQLFTFS